MAHSLTWSAVFALVVALALPLAGAPGAITTAVAQEVSAVRVAVQRGRRVVVVIESLRNGRGQVLGGLYTNPRVWLREGHAAADCIAPIRGGRAECVFENVMTQRFAFAGMHDEDSDRELDRDALGLPQEGYAFSNDAREPFGPPSFAAAAFEGARLVVHARYGL